LINSENVKALFASLIATRNQKKTEKVMKGTKKTKSCQEEAVRSRRPTEMKVLRLIQGVTQRQAVE